jgi:hypothetical protein
MHSRGFGNRRGGGQRGKTYVGLSGPMPIIRWRMIPTVLVGTTLKPVSTPRCDGVPDAETESQSKASPQGATKLQA